MALRGKRHCETELEARLGVDAGVSTPCQGPIPRCTREEADDPDRLAPFGHGVPCRKVRKVVTQSPALYFGESLSHPRGPTPIGARDRSSNSQRREQLALWLSGCWSSVFVICQPTP